MNIVKKLEKKFGRFSISKLYLYIIMIIVAGYIFCYMFPSIYYYLPFSAYEVIIKHQYWRLFTWLFTIPYGLENTLNMIFLPINLYFYYFVGRNLEAIFGKFAFNFYVFMGWLFSTIGMLLISVAMLYWSSQAEIIRYALETMYETGKSNHFMYTALPATYYMLTSIFFAFALIFGETKILLWFVIPFKVKWSAWITGIFMAYSFLRGDAYSRTLIIACTLNFLIFYFMFRYARGRSLKMMKRHIAYTKAVRDGERARYNRNSGSDQGTGKSGSNVAKFPVSDRIIHRCCICGRTEKDDPNLEFRYCSKCDGEREYCSDHLYTHKHVVNGSTDGE